MRERERMERRVREREGGRARTGGGTQRENGEGLDWRCEREGGGLDWR